MDVTIHPAGDADPRRVRAQSAIGTFAATWRGAGDPPLGATVDVELTVPETLRWGSSITLEPPTTQHGIADDGPSVVATGAASSDGDAVLSVRLGTSLLLVESDRVIDPGDVGMVRFRADVIELYPTGL